MYFDNIVSNPPYATTTKIGKKSTALWHKFTEHSINSLTDCGYLVTVHPPGWRNISGRYSKTKDLITSKQVLQLSIYNMKSGLKEFKASTPYDIYCLRNKPTNGLKTKIVCQDGSIYNYDISKLKFIPNGMFKDVFALMVNPYND